MNLKEKLVDLLGGLGGLLYFAISFLLPLFPIVMIKISFDLSFLLVLVMTALLFIAPTFFTFCFWLIGLIGVILGPQDVIAIIYYVIFVIAFVPQLISIVINFTRK